MSKNPDTTMESLIELIKERGYEISYFWDTEAEWSDEGVPSWVVQLCRFPLYSKKGDSPLQRDVMTSDLDLLRAIEEAFLCLEKRLAETWDQEVQEGNPHE